MDQLQLLREQRDSAQGELETLAKIEDRSLNASECDKYDELEKHIDTLDQDIRSERTRSSISDRMNAPKTAFSSPSKRAEASTENEWDQCLRYWKTRGRDVPQIRTLNETDDADTIPTDLLDELVRLMGEVSGVRQAVEVRSYPNGVEIPQVATRVSVTGVTAEGVAFTDTEPTFSKVDFSDAPSATATTELTVQIMQDARPDLVREVLTQHAEELSRFWGSCYVEGLGSSDADVDGIFSKVNASVNDLTAAGVTIAAADLIKLRYETLPAKYWTQGGTLSWLMGQDSLAAIMALQADSRPLFQPAADATLANALQGTILGLPVYIDQSVPAYAASGTCIALLNQSSYRIADRDPGLVSNINEFAQQNKGIVEVNSYFRSCGRWMRPEAAALLTMAAS